MDQFGRETITEQIDRMLNEMYGGKTWGVLGKDRTKDLIRAIL